MLQGLDHDIVSCMMVHNTNSQYLTEAGMELRALTQLFVSNPLFEVQAAKSWVHLTLELSHDQILEMYSIWRPFKDIELSFSGEDETHNY